MGNRSPHSLRSGWKRQRAVDRWRRLSGRWWQPGMELDFAAVWATWIEANDGDEYVALGHVLLVLDRIGLLDDKCRSA